MFVGVQMASPHRAGVTTLSGWEVGLQEDSLCSQLQLQLQISALNRHSIESVDSISLKFDFQVYMKSSLPSSNTMQQGSLALFDCAGLVVVMMLGLLCTI